jgi:hypothetical protein
MGYYIHEEYTILDSVPKKYTQVICRTCAKNLYDLG